MKIVAHIPARAGSKRLEKKNLKPICGHPMIYYSIKEAKEVAAIDELYVNTDCSEIKKIAENCHVKVFDRDESLAEDHITQDDFNFDFVKKIESDIMILINPVCPLIESSDIENAITRFFDSKADCLLTTSDYQTLALLDEVPINFSLKNKLPRTQDVGLIRHLNFAIGIWNTRKFVAQYEKYNSACILENTIFYSLAHSKSVKVNNEDDFYIVESLLMRRSLK